MSWGAMGSQIMKGFSSQLKPASLMQNANAARRSADPGNPANAAVGLQLPANGAQQPAAQPTLADLPVTQPSYQALPPGVSQVAPLTGPGTSIHQMLASIMQRPRQQ